MSDLTAAVVDALPMSGCLVDQDGAILAVSEEWRRFGKENGARQPDYGLGTNYVALCAASADAATRAIGRGLKTILEGEGEEFRHVYSCHAPWEARWYRVVCKSVKVDGRRMALVVHTSVTGEILNSGIAKKADREAACLREEQAEVLHRLAGELRAPLNTIIGLSNMLSQSVFGPLGHARYEDYAAEIGSTGRRLRDLVDDVVELAQMDSGSLPLAADSIDLAAMCDQLAQAWRERAGERRVEVCIQASDDLPCLRADAVRVRQMVGFLLQNAVEAAPAASRVMLGAALDAAGRLTVTVSKPGAAPPRKGQVRLTEHFCSDGEPMAGPRHPGLGLALTRGLIERHGGCLILRACPEHGTEITLRFPRTRTLRATG